MFPFCLKKTTTSFFTYLTRFSFFVFVRKKQVSLLLGFKQRKKRQQLSLFVSSFFFFASPVMTIDDRWVGGMEFPI